MNASFHTSNFRPVELTEAIRVDRNIVTADGALIRALPPKVNCEWDSVDTIELAAETVADGGQVSECGYMIASSHPVYVPRRPVFAGDCVLCDETAL